MVKAAFLDRDGVINRNAPEGQYVTRWDDFQMLPGVVEGIGQLHQAGYSVIVVTNQRCVAKGLITERDLQSLHRQMTWYLSQAGAAIDAFYYCPHDVEPPCRCRKPAPGMLLDAAGQHGFDLAKSWMIGDSEVDIQAGKNAGCKTARLWVARETGSGPTGSVTLPYDADITAQSLLEAVRQILQSGNS